MKLLLMLIAAILALAKGVDLDEESTVRKLDSGIVCPESHVLCLGEDKYTICGYIGDYIFVLDDEFSCPANSECVAEPQNPCKVIQELEIPTSSTTTTTTTTTTTIKPPKKPVQPPVCKDLGSVHPGPTCQQYYKCEWKPLNSWKTTLYQCPAEQAFSEKAKRCVPAGESECED